MFHILPEQVNFLQVLCSIGKAVIASTRRNQLLLSICFAVKKAQKVQKSNNNT